MADVLTYSVFRGDEMNSSAWTEVSELFSTEYGYYSDKSPIRPGERIRMGVKRYERSYANGDYRVALCRDGERLIAEAVYKEFATSRGNVAFVVQLVVAGDYRRRGIASTLLHAIWGFSDYYAWGIVTSNAFTVESLESATFRRVCPSLLIDRSAWIGEELLPTIDFLDRATWTATTEDTRIATGFYTDRKKASPSASDVARRLGGLAEGEEWLAIVFRDQELDDISAYRTMIEASETMVRSAYARMPQSEQAWAAKTAQEIEVILSGIGPLPREAEIVDFGAGSGRHVEELRRRGFLQVTGMDFAADGKNVLSADCRDWKSPRPIDFALCLYDVVGSFAADADNEAIIRNIATNLRVGGRAVFSVSNWNYLDTRVIGKIDFSDPSEAARRLFALPPSRRMQENGEFFDGAALLVDERRHLVCHKEQFPPERGALPGEYLIRDRRFTAEEITAILERSGLSVVSTRFVRAGFDVDYAVSTGKEILLFAVKRNKEDK